MERAHNTGVHLEAGRVGPRLAIIDGQDCPALSCHPAGKVAHGHNGSPADLYGLQPITCMATLALSLMPGTLSAFPLCSRFNTCSVHTSSERVEWQVLCAPWLERMFDVHSQCRA